MATIQHHIWPGCSTVSPFIVSDKALDVIAFAKAVFGAEPIEEPILRADGTLAHAAIKLGDTTIMLGDPRAPEHHHSAFLQVYVPDCDAIYRKALAAGAESVMEPSDQFYGDRASGVRDMAGNTWWISTHTERISHAEIVRRQAALDAAT
ncbi:VOC family protein [Acuticoccus sp. M5D2P5]|uniref:VOC family protein n=1 Tax=Acuticoccus kalidii TaxID=2910977 RepID=UPI001F491DB3|nr:VOC family protein [Acuticoccus kalidii]MCF3932155.1 VOC family protein [Acuticoccus kalidii]